MLTLRAGIRESFMCVKDGVGEANAYERKDRQGIGKEAGMKRRIDEFGVITI